MAVDVAYEIHIMDNNSFEIRKKELALLALSAGFNNLRGLSEACGVNEANLYTNLRGTYNMSMKRMFAIAKAVRRPIDEIIEIFYPGEINENRRIFEDECQRLANCTMGELREHVVALRSGM